jgi:hypothetical protein
MTATLEETGARALFPFHITARPCPWRSRGSIWKGPFLSCGNRGAHPAALLTLPDDGWRELIERYRGFVRPHHAFAGSCPACQGLHPLVCFARRCGVGGHDEGWDEAIDPAIDAGCAR